MTKRSIERTQFLQDVLSTAIEGGINYWAYIFEAVRADNKPGYEDATGWHYESIKFIDYEEDVDEAVEALNAGLPCPVPVFEVNIEKVATGVSKVIAAVKAEKLFLDGDVVLGNRENDAGDFDAFAADAVIQFAVFGELVYG